MTLYRYHDIETLLYIEINNGERIAHRYSSNTNIIYRIHFDKKNYIFFFLYEW